MFLLHRQSCSGSSRSVQPAGQMPHTLLQPSDAHYFKKWSEQGGNMQPRLTSGNSCSSSCTVPHVEMKSCKMRYVEEREREKKKRSNKYRHVTVNVIIPGWHRNWSDSVICLLTFNVGGTHPRAPLCETPALVCSFQSFPCWTPILGVLQLGSAYIVTHYT